MASERPFLAGAAVGCFFSCRTVLFGVGSGLLVWCRVAAQVMRSTQAWLSNSRTQTNCFVDDPIIPLETRHIKSEGWPWVWWSTLGLKLAYEKRSFGPRPVWIDTQLEINAGVNKLEVLPVKKKQEILEALAHVMDSPGGVPRLAQWLDQATQGWRNPSRLLRPEKSVAGESLVG